MAGGVLPSGGVLEQLGGEADLVVLSGLTAFELTYSDRPIRMLRNVSIPARAALVRASVRNQRTASRMTSRGNRCRLEGLCRDITNSSASGNNVSDIFIVNATVLAEDTPTAAAELAD